MLENKVLIVDDTEEYNEVLSLVLESEGYKTEQHYSYDTIEGNDYLAYFFDLNCEYKDRFYMGGLRFVHENGFYFPADRRVLMSSEIVGWEKTGQDGYFFDKLSPLHFAVDIVKTIEDKLSLNPDYKNN